MTLAHHMAAAEVSPSEHQQAGVLGPAGERYWSVDGRYHRLDGPAVIEENGSQRWYFKGKLHRVDGPALNGGGGNQHWMLDGKRHRLDGPAIVETDGSQHWYVRGQRHRIDGPAYIGAAGTIEWFVHDRDVSDEVAEFIEQMGFPADYREWETKHALLFQIRFSGGL